MRSLVSAVAVGLVLSACARNTPTAPSPSGRNAPPANAAVPGDSAAPGGGRAGAAGEPRPQAYSKVVTSAAQTREGLFKVHRIGPKLLFEIPADQLNKDILLVSEIAQTTLGVGYGGASVGNRVLNFERRGNHMYLRGKSYSIRADSTTPEYRAVQAANVRPIIAVFNIESYGADSAAVIDVTRLFTQPPNELGVSARIPGSIDAARSWVENAVPFPDNVNVTSTLTINRTASAARGGAPPAAPGGGTTASTILMHWSFHRLPDVPMMPRLCDDRVGYFSVRYTDFTDRDGKVQPRCLITRYRLEKKNPGAAVSDPVKPIVYYIDPATPTKWVPFFKKGVEAWQRAFLEAGFSNAIIAKEAPKDDPDWSAEDARYSVIRWLPSTTENASGPHVNDPRSGEILNAHVQFYHNVQNLQNSWYFAQVAALDPRARLLPFPDSLMGRALEYVVAHEVGHTLGFQHNMKASSTYPVDSLRSVSFLREWGHTPTLMDYSRFNYVAQPEDNVPVELLTPDIGPYDKWATKWGYAPIPGARTPEEERPTLDAWAREQDSKPYLRFSTSGAGGVDPGDITEAVGDQDAVKATGYGIANIKRTVPYLIPATVKPTENYDNLSELYGRLIGQWRTELGHVVNIIGGADTREKYGSQTGPRFMPLSESRQKEAVRFLNENGFRTPTFFLEEDILRRIEPTGSVARVVNAQSSLLASTLSSSRLMRLSEWQATTGYSPIELMADVRSGVFSEIRGNQEIDIYRRALQRSYVEMLSLKINPPAPAAGAASAFAPTTPTLAANLSDLYPSVRAELNALDAELRSAIPRSSGLKRAHLEDLRFRIADALRMKD